MSVRRVCEVLQCTMDPSVGPHHPFLQASNLLTKDDIPQHKILQLQLVRCANSILNDGIARVMLWLKDGYCQLSNGVNRMLTLCKVSTVENHTKQYQHQGARTRGCQILHRGILVQTRHGRKALKHGASQLQTGL